MYILFQQYNSDGSLDNSESAKDRISPLAQLGKLVSPVDLSAASAAASCLSFSQASRLREEILMGIVPWTSPSEVAQSGDAW